MLFSKHDKKPTLVKMIDSHVLKVLRRPQIVFAETLDSACNYYLHEIIKYIFLGGIVHLK